MTGAAKDTGEQAAGAAKDTGGQAAGAAQGTVQKAAGAAKNVGQGVAGTAKAAGKGLLAALPTERLTQEAQNLLHAAGARLLAKAGDKIEGLTGRLSEYAASGGEGGKGLIGTLTGSDKSGGGGGVMGEVVKGGLKGGLKGIMQKITGGKGAKGGFEKVTNIVETIDVGAPRRLVYDQWTQFQDFPTFMKKVETVKQESDEDLMWKAQVFWSHRNWKAHIIEQLPDQRIIWRSEGQKGYVDGAVTFHELSEDLTRILVVLEYHPQGLFERTGNLWRAQGRRVRLELKHFRRHVMAHLLLNPDDLEGWRGEIRDSEVVKDHETAMEEERAAQEEEEGAEEDEGAEATGERAEAEEGEGEGEEGEEEEGEEPEEGEGEEARQTTAEDEQSTEDEESEAGEGEEPEGGDQEGSEEQQGSEDQKGSEGEGDEESEAGEKPPTGKQRTWDKPTSRSGRSPRIPRRMPIRRRRSE
ncbi:SRPBCC family protein [Nonomuraea fuscirosea]|uniref:SRPBCC family protein n=1 Tax=Nonomuraea fuscirosea TaxID=1291556 RepID=UPI002DD9E122|nr:SRPBCC family protein [Nonomuraea fuscirosea]WSA50935.1 SRPBCC family protein [Nonomuraea fuscirosea]